MSIGCWLIHPDSAVLSAAGYLSKRLIPFPFHSLSLPLLSFSGWFTQRTSVSQAVSLSLHISTKYSRGKKSHLLHFSQPRQTGWLEAGDAPGSLCYRHRAELHVLPTKVYPRETLQIAPRKLGVLVMRRDFLVRDCRKLEVKHLEAWVQHRKFLSHMPFPAGKFAMFIIYSLAILEMVLKYLFIFHWLM